MQTETIPTCKLGQSLALTRAGNVIHEAHALELGEVHVVGEEATPVGLHAVACHIAAADLQRVRRVLRARGAAVAAGCGGSVGRAN